MEDDIADDGSVRIRAHPASGHRPAGPWRALLITGTIGGIVFDDTATEVVASAGFAKAVPGDLICWGRLPDNHAQRRIRSGNDPTQEYRLPFHGHVCNDQTEERVAAASCSGPNPCTFHRGNSHEDHQGPCRELAG